MEETSKEDQSKKTELKGNKEDQVDKTLKEGGELEFRSLESKDQELNPILYKPVFVKQRKNNTEFIIAESRFYEHQIYKIENQKITFVSSHKIEIPIKVQTYNKCITENHIRYICPKELIERRKHHEEFFKTHGIEWGKDPSFLVFEAEYGIRKPRVIQAKFLGELKKQAGGFKGWVFEDMFDNQKDLFNRSLSLFKARKKQKPGEWFDSASDLEAYFLGEFGSQYPNLTKRIFEFNLSPLGLHGYQEKIRKDRERLEEKFLGNPGFYGSGKLYLENWEPGFAEKLKPFIKVDKKMMIIGLVDFRKKIVPVKALISIYELFASLSFKSQFMLTFCNLIGIDYSAEIDMLALEVWVNLRFVVENPENIDSVIEVGSDEGSISQKNPSLIRSGNRLYEEAGTCYETAKVRFKIWNVFDETRRRIEGQNLGYTGNSSFKKSQGTMTFFDENSKRIQIHVYSKGSKEGEKSNTEGEEEEGHPKGYSLVEKTELIIDKEELFRTAGVSGNAVKTAFMVDSEKLVVVCGPTMLLYELKSSTLLSSCGYSQDATIYKSLVEKDIMVEANDDQGYLQVFRISTNDSNLASFKRLGTIHLKDIEPLFHSISKLLAFKNVDHETYEIKVIAEWMKSEHSSITSELIYSVRFTINDADESTSQPLKISKSSIDHRLTEETAGWNVRAYFKQKKWKIVLFQRNQALCIEQGLNSDSGSIFADRLDFRGGEGGIHYIHRVYLAENRVYLDTELTEGRILKRIEYGVNGEGVQRIANEDTIKTLAISESANVYFDESTEKFRIFVEEPSEDLEGKVFKVLDGEFEVIKEFYFPGLDRVDHFKVISENWVYLACSVRFQEDSNPGDEYGEQYAGPKKVSLIINLAEMVMRKLVVQGEGALLGDLYDVGGGNLLSFSRDGDSDGSDGFYACKFKV